jgi:hypothetical protein
MKRFNLLIHKKNSELCLFIIKSDYKTKDVTSDVCSAIHHRGCAQ